MMHADSLHIGDMEAARATYRAMLVAIAHAEVGTHEEGGQNIGAKIVEYQRATDLTPSPWPWCAAFCCWVLKKWLQSTEVRMALGLGTEEAAEAWRCHSASHNGWLKWAQHRGIQVLGEDAEARAGDFVVYDFPHIGIVAADDRHDGYIETIEGNTSDGVYMRHRAKGLIEKLIRVLP